MNISILILASPLSEGKIHLEACNLPVRSSRKCALAQVIKDLKN